MLGGVGLQEHAEQVRSLIRERCENGEMVRTSCEKSATDWNSSRLGVVASGEANLKAGRSR